MATEVKSEAKVDDYIRQLVICARALPQREWQWGTFLRPDGQPIETVEHVCEAQNHSARERDNAELWGVNYGPDSPVVCFTGNGPCSKDHAQFLAAVQPRNLLWLLDEIGARMERMSDALRQIAACEIEFSEGLPAGHGPPVLSAEQMAALAHATLNPSPA